MKGEKTGGSVLHRDAMTGMALAFLGHCDASSPEFGRPLKKGSIFLPLLHQINSQIMNQVESFLA